MENEVHIFDDIIDLNYQEQIKTTLLENDFPWYYIHDVTNPYVNKQQSPGFQHNLVLEYGQENSPHHILFENLIKICCAKFNRQSVEVIKGRCFLQLPLNLKNNDVDMPHTDTHHNHIVILYYALDSDGDTIIYNEKIKSDNYTVKKRVTPKQGRVVIFDGGLFHTAEQPINNTRCIVNYNVN